MPLASNDAIREIKERINLVDFATKYLDLKRDGFHMTACCPFHEEKTPSFKIDPNTNRFTCFGCGEHGDVIDFAQQVRGVGWREAVDMLAQELGIEVAPMTEDEKNRVAKHRDATRQYHWLNHTACCWFKDQLHGESQEAEEARAYLHSRGFSDETIQAWHLGLAPQAGGLRSLLQDLIKSNGKEWAPVQNAALKIGLFGKSDRDGFIYEKFRSRIIFPIFDIRHHVIGFGGRTTTDHSHKYKNSEETPLYRKSKVLYGINNAAASIRKQGRVIVVEGYTDVMAMHQAGITNAVGLCGTAVTSDHIKEFERMHVEVVLRFDDDSAKNKTKKQKKEAELARKRGELPAGEKAAEKTSQLLIPTEIPFRVSFGDQEGAKDVCEFLNFANKAISSASEKGSKNQVQSPSEDHQNASEAPEMGRLSQDPSKNWVDAENAPPAPPGGETEASDTDKGGHEDASGDQSMPTQSAAASILLSQIESAPEGFAWYSGRLIDRAGDMDVMRLRVVREIVQLIQRGKDTFLIDTRLEALAKRAGFQIRKMKEIAKAVRCQSTHAPSPHPTQKTEASDTDGNGGGGAVSDSGPSSGGEGGPPTIRHDPSGAAEMLHYMHGENMRFVFDWNGWLWWTGKIWSPNHTHLVERSCKDVIAWAYGQAEKAEAEDDEDKAKSFSRLAKSLASASGRDGLLRNLRAEPGVAIQTDELDNAPMLLPVANGRIDLYSGALLEHEREPMLTLCLPWEYHPEATCDTWLSFLDDIFDKDDELISFLQRSLGYTLTGFTEEQKLFFMLGDGCNGKSTFIETIMTLLGEYAVKSPKSIILSGRFAQTIEHDVAGLKGKRLCVPPEIEEGQMLDEAKVKDITGGDTLTARFLYGNLFQFAATCKLWMYGNHKPVIKGADKGIWRRILLIPFEVEIPKEKRDPKLPQKLKDEIPGILTWAVQGCLKWQEEGLLPPEKVLVATDEYKLEQDLIGQFIGDCCEAGEGRRESKQRLYDAYKQWMENEGIHAVSQPKFRARLLRIQGLEEIRTKEGRYWGGISLLEMGSGRADW